MDFFTQKRVGDLQMKSEFCHFKGTLKSIETAA